MEAENILLGRLLRIITPEEIVELTSTSTGSKKVSLTSIIEEELYPSGHDSEHQAKILPFVRPNKIEEDGEVKQEDNQELKVEETAEVETPQTKIANTELETEILQEETQTTSSEERVDTTTFLLAEKKRFEKNQKILKGREVLSLYLQNSQVSIEQEKKLKEDLSQDTVKGILVNKRRA